MLRALCCAVSSEEATVLRVENGMWLLACAEGMLFSVEIQKQVAVRAVSAVLVAQGIHSAAC